MNRQKCSAMLLMIGLGAFSVAMAGGFPRHAAASSQGYLGVELRDLQDEQVNALHLKDNRGAEILRVDHDGPAGKAGLHEHDVVLQFNGQVINGQDDLRRMLRATTPGTQVNLLVLRDGQQQTVTAQMANREEVERRAWEQHIVVPDPDGQPPLDAAEKSAHPSRLGFLHSTPSNPAQDSGGHTHSFLGTMLGAPYTGLTLEPLGPQLGEFFGVQSGAGLLVRSVDPNSPGAMAGLHAGDVVIKANQVTMTTESEWTKTLHENRGRAVPVLVLREKKEETLTLTPDPKRKSKLEEPRSSGSEKGADEAMLTALSAFDPRD